MNWKTIKTFLIILFLILNIFLIFLTFQMNNAKKISQNEVSEAIKLLEKNNIYVDKSIIPLLPCEANTINLTDIYYAQESFEKISRNSNEIIIEIPYVSNNKKSIKNNVINSLNKSGFDTDNIQIEQIKDNEFRIKYYINDMQVFNNNINIVINNDIMVLKGRWYIYDSDNAYNWEYSGSGYATSALINFISHPKRDSSKKTTITDIDYGYYAGSESFNENYKIISSSPCYRLTTDDGMMYYYNISEGTFVN